MKSVSKKIIALVLAMAMMFSFGAIAFAEDEVEEIAETEEAVAALVFATDSLEDDNFAIVGIEEGEVAEDGILNIPAVIVKNEAEYPIAAIGEQALSYNTEDPTVDTLKNVTEIVVEDGIKNVGNNAFANMPALTKITFNGDVTLGENAFENCTALETVIFKGNATIGNEAFKACENLETIETVADKKYDCPKNAIVDTLWYKNFDVDFVTLGTTLIAYKGADEEETIPLNITVIGDSAFEGNESLKKIILTKYVDTIGDRAFANCSSLTEVVFSNFGEIKELGDDIFVGTPYYDDYKGEFFTIGNKLIKYMGKDVSYVVIPNTITSIADNCFEGCYVTKEDGGYSFVISSILVPASVTELGEDCFVLAKFSDEETYSPRIYAYDNTPAMEALTEAGYLVTAMKYKTADLDADGKITAADARLALRYAVGLEDKDEFLENAADLDGDGKVTSADARLILRIAVGLEDYDIDSLLTLPKTKYEVLAAYNNSMVQAAKYGLGFTKVVSNKITASDICNIHSDKLIALANTNAVNQTYKYLSNQQVSVDALPEITIQDLSLIKNAKCVAKDGKYYITITFADVNDCEITSDAAEYTGAELCYSSFIPTVSGKTFYDAFSANKWFQKLVADDDTLSPNCVRKYALSYNNAKVNAIIDIETGKPETVILSVGYHFAVDGRINGLDISSEGFKTGDATIDRLDTVTFKNFN